MSNILNIVWFANTAGRKYESGVEAKRVIGGGLLALAGTALAEEFVVRAFDWVWDAIVGPGALSGRAIMNIAGICLMIGGLFIVLLPSRESDQKRLALVGNMTKLRTRLGTGAQRDARLFGEIVSVYYGLDKLGIVTPRQSDGANIDHYAVALSFISSVLPMVRDGHLREAREQAPAIIEALGTTGTRFKPPLYKRVWPISLAFRQPIAA